MALAYDDAIRRRQRLLAAAHARRMDQQQGLLMRASEFAQMPHDIEQGARRIGEVDADIAAEVQPQQIGSGDIRDDIQRRKAQDYNAVMQSSPLLPDHEGEPWNKEAARRAQLILANPDGMNLTQRIWPHAGSPFPRLGQPDSSDAYRKAWYGGDDSHVGGRTPISLVGEDVVGPDDVQTMFSAGAPEPGSTFRGADSYQLGPSLSMRDRGPRVPEGPMYPNAVPYPEVEVGANVSAMGGPLAKPGVAIDPDTGKPLEIEVSKPDVPITTPTPTPDTAATEQADIGAFTNNFLATVQKRKKTISAAAMLWGVPDRSDAYEAKAIGKYTQFMDQRAAQMALSSPLSSRNAFLLDFLKSGGSIDKAIALSGALEFAADTDIDSSILTSDNFTPESIKKYARSGKPTDLEPIAKRKNQQAINFVDVDGVKHIGMISYDDDGQVQFLQANGEPIPEGEGWVLEKGGGVTIEGDKPPQMSEAIKVNLAQQSLKNWDMAKEFFLDEGGNVDAGLLDIIKAKSGWWKTDGRKVHVMMRNALRDGLRLESGAAIGIDEFKQFFADYAPDAGDDKATIKYKLEAWDRRMRGVVNAKTPDWATKNLGNPMWEPAQVTSDADVKALAPGSWYQTPTMKEQNKIAQKKRI